MKGLDWKEIQCKLVLQMAVGLVMFSVATKQVNVISILLKPSCLLGSSSGYCIFFDLCSFVLCHVGEVDVKETIVK